ncbi:MAG: hypothetical protein ACE5E4_04780 [Candidatus Binatia bacterium]
MEISPRQLVPFVAPMLIGYLTYSLVWARATPFQLVQSSSIMAFRRTTPPDIAGQYRITGDPFFRNELAFEDAVFGGGDDAEFSGDTDLSDSATALAVDEIQLDGTVVVGDFRMALINGAHLHEGDDYKGYRVDRVRPTSVTVSRDDWSWELELEPLYARGETSEDRSFETDDDETASVDRASVAEGHSMVAIGGTRLGDAEPRALQGEAAPVEGSDEH